MEGSELTYGQKAVGLTFNPSNDPAVDSCKQGFADLIDQLDSIRIPTNTAEKNRLLSAAITQIQTAQMWAVKAITWKD